MIICPPLCKYQQAGVGKKGDMKEMFSVGPYQASAGMPLPRYPPTPANMRADWQNYFEAMEVLDKQRK
jgi:hypothetical protein